MAAETRGWVSGSVYEFLGLSPEESAYVDLKLRLSNALRRYRTLRPLSQKALAKLIKSSQSRVAKMENGDPSVTIDLLLRALIRLGVTREQIARLLVFDEPKPTFTGIATEATTRPSLPTPVWGLPNNYNDGGWHSEGRQGAGRATVQIGELAGVVATLSKCKGAPA